MPLFLIRFEGTGQTYDQDINNRVKNSFFFEHSQISTWITLKNVTACQILLRGWCWWCHLISTCPVSFATNVGCRISSVTGAVPTFRVYYSSRHSQFAACAESKDLDLFWTDHLRGKQYCPGCFCYQGVCCYFQCICLSSEEVRGSLPVLADYMFFFPERHWLT